MPHIRSASQGDNEALLELTRATSMPGPIGLRIDRDPDFFRLLRLRGEGEVLVEEAGGEIRGCISITRRRVWAAGEPRALWYVGDLKVHHLHRKPGVGARLAKGALERMTAAGGDLLACVVAEGNRQVFPFLEGRIQIPPFRSLGPLDVLMVLSSRRRPSGRFTVRESTGADVPELKAIYEETGRAFELAPLLEEDDWRRATEEDPALCTVLVAEERGRIQATAWLFDCQWAKQHRVISLSGGLSTLVTPLRPLGAISPAFRIPREGETVAVLALRHLGVRMGNLAAARALVQEGRRRAHAGGFAFLLYGLHRRDPLRPVFRHMPHFTMGSELFLTSIQGNEGLLEQVARGVPVEDYALA